MNINFEKSSGRDKKGASHCKRLSRGLILEYIRRVWVDIRRWLGVVRGCRGS